MDLIKILAPLLMKPGRIVTTDLAMDGESQLRIKLESAIHPRTTIAIVPRPEGVILLSYQGIYKFNTGDVVAAIVRLTDHITEKCDAVFDPNVFDLSPYSYQQFIDDARNRRIAFLLENGWTLVPDDEDSKLWAEFTKRFSFRESSSKRNPAVNIETTAPFAAWSVSTTLELRTTSRPSFEAIETGARKGLLELLGHIANDTVRMLALDLNHHGYSFDPRDVAIRNLESWPVPVIPAHDFSLFTDEQFSFGLFSDPSLRSICVWGEPIVDRLTRDPLSCFGSAIDL